MKSDETLPLMEQVGETKAEAEDRLERLIVPRIDAVMTALAGGWETMRDRFAHRHPAQR